MESTNPLLSISSFVHHNCLRIGAELSARVDDTKRFAGALAANWQATERRRTLQVAPPAPPFAWFCQPKPALAATAKTEPDRVAKTLVGTAVYTVSNSNNEFVLISDSDATKSIGLLCFRREDAESFLAQVRLRRRELKSGAKVVPITLDQVYQLKVEGIAFRFLPDPVQIKNALDLKDGNAKKVFDGVPVFQSELLVVKKKNKRYLPLYFSKEDIEKELSKVSRARVLSSQIQVGSLEDVLRKMETSEKNSEWEDLIFIPPGKTHSQHIVDVSEKPRRKF